MAPEDSITDIPKGDPGRARGPRRGGRILAGLLAVAVVLLLVGFVRFAVSVSHEGESTTPSTADGIVVFTGGQDRIARAMDLLAEGRAKRLLVSGVHPKTTRDMLSALTGVERDLLRCCVDLDRRARDTIGNADETAAWARRHGFSSLIVVTSSYHMPRSLTELGHALPGVRLVGHSIVTPALDITHWWRDPGAVKLLVWEYFKLLATNVRLALAPRELPDQMRAGSL